MTSQLVIFRAFLFIFLVPSTLYLKNISRKSTNKKNLALTMLILIKTYDLIMKFRKVKYFIYFMLYDNTTKRTCAPNPI